MAWRGFCSLLRAHGYTNPEQYTLGYLFDEYLIVVERNNLNFVEAAVIHRLGVSSILSEKAGEMFNEEINKKLG